VEKALEAIVYVSHRTNDLFHIVKTLYYADKMHLEKYGRLITGDYYVAMREGPVPSGAYELIKRVRGDNQEYESRIVKAHPEEAIQVKNHDDVTPRRAPNLDYLSESDLECLNESIRLYAGMDLKELWRIAHEEDAYKKSRRNGSMQLTDIILSLPNGKDVLEYLDS
jgi:uncharacterized phage-associated protein